MSPPAEKPPIVTPQMILAGKLAWAQAGAPGAGNLNPFEHMFLAMWGAMDREAET